MEVIFSGRNIQLILVPSTSGNLRVTGDEETVEYLTTKGKIDSLINRISQLRKLQVLFHDDTSFTGKIGSFLRNDTAMLNTIYLVYSKAFPGAISTHILNAKRYHIPDSRLPVEKQTADVLDHYFINFKPEDEVLFNTNVPGDVIADFMSLATGLQTQSPDSLAIDAIVRFLDPVKHADTLVSVYGKLMQRWLMEKGMDLALEYLEVNYLASQCRSGVETALKERVEAYKRTAKGSPAPEIIWLDAQNGVHKLSALDKNKNTLLIFWASWCEHCEAILPDVNRYTNASNSLNVVAIGLDDKENDWNKAIQRYPSWVHLRAPEKWNNDWVKLYGIYGTPTFFLIDKNGNVVGRGKDMQDIKKLEKEAFLQ
jgi:thiol-disulfide isomerase/thioredoxin